MQDANANALVASVLKPVALSVQRCMVVFPKVFTSSCQSYSLASSKYFRIAGSAFDANHLLASNVIFYRFPLLSIDSV